jgi:hypothetical protein
MAPWKGLLTTEEAAKSQGCNVLTFCFKRARPGRPKKRGNSANNNVQAQPAISNKKKMQGPVPQITESAGSMVSMVAAVATLDAPMQQTKKARTNWGKSEAKIKLEKAVQEWDEKGKQTFDGNGKQLQLKACLNVVGIPYDAFKKHATKDGGKRRSLRRSVGRELLIAEEEQQFLANVFARKDQGNDGAILTKGINHVVELSPELTPNQALLHLTGHF